MDNSRSTRHKKKKKKKRGLRRFLTVLVLLLIAAGAYVYFQYKQGMSEALDGAGKEKAASYDFNGKLPNNGQINVLLLGSDSRGEKHSRTDSILIAHYNQNTHEPKLVSIMRDSYVDVPGHGKQKINAAFAFGGPELLRKTIEENFGININYYSIVDFKGFPKIVDTIAPDGIKVNVPHDMSSGIDMTLHKGEQTLHGKELLGYVRFRHDNMSDFGRVQRQQEVLGKLKDKATEINNVVKLPKILGMTAPYIDTNIDTKTMLILGKDVITGQAKSVDKLRIPLDGTFENERIPGIGAVLAVDLEKNKAALQQFLSSSK
ncbi:transcriptional attenuator, LytR family [Bacillus sp. OV322]|uniref:LCP family protein n=1 Tax=Bacillus sp. OV322 TaxID=1882764 RepID=UPI0008E7B465|nr:LCP family protein [Bacillus sp. OV322]SFC23220.1 transcriptional attenuator, LytR family [Bacillus sp. OV322]